VSSAPHIPNRKLVVYGEAANFLRLCEFVLDVSKQNFRELLVGRV
jgi:hypothetical protein